MTLIVYFPILVVSVAAAVVALCAVQMRLEALAIAAAGLATIGALLGLG